MRISAKGRYGLAAMVYVTMHSDSREPQTVSNISKNLGISKIYLEQVFSQLRKSGLLLSVKGSQGGYRLSRMPGQISALDVLCAVDSSLFERTEDTVREAAPHIESAIRVSAFDKLDLAVRGALSGVTLQELAEEAQRQGGDGAYMFYI